jgi:Transglutaminase-like superfamily
VSPKYALAFAVDLGRVLLAFPTVERGRSHAPPGPLLARLRARGIARRERSSLSRARLARAIAWVDRLGPGGPNCLRRTLLRVALDPLAAREPVVFGLDMPEAKGHAWVSGTEETDRYDVEFRV